jgi:membrane protein implicated in regulation of membrane protease activity
MTKKYLHVRKVSTNADRAIGQTGVVVETVDNMAGKGLVSIAGRLWTARSDTGEVIEKDSEVSILRIEGVKVIVTPVAGDAQHSGVPENE